MHYQTSKKVVSRIINDELIVIQLDTGKYHYFTKDTQELLDFFKEGAPDSAELKSICKQLLDRKILERTNDGKMKKISSKANYQFLRDGEKNLDQISFASP